MLRMLRSDVSHEVAVPTSSIGCSQSPTFANVLTFVVSMSEEEIDDIFVGVVHGLVFVFVLESVVVVRVKKEKRMWEAGIETEPTVQKLAELPLGYWTQTILIVVLFIEYQY